jgi:hypothetical protein
MLGSEAVSALSRRNGSPTRGKWVYRPIESRLNPCKRSVNAALASLTGVRSSRRAVWLDTVPPAYARPATRQETESARAWASSLRASLAHEMPVSAILRTRSPRDHMRVSVAEPEPLISREEVVATMFIVADVAAEARLIRRLLEEKGEEEEEQEGDR